MSQHDTGSDKAFFPGGVDDEHAMRMPTHHLPAFPAPASVPQPLVPLSHKPKKRLPVTRVRQMSRLDMAAEVEDPYVMGWNAAADLDNPVPCPYLNKDGLHYKLWRKGYSDRVDDYIANVRRYGGMHASITGSTPGITITRSSR